ncbi:MAG: FliH/SctL family protein [Thermodesulfobacteriota bacterium]|nr:FliH/SctL family protein [Thermodesulfobacteriota bacterium]
MSSIFSRGSPQAVNTKKFKPPHFEGEGEIVPAEVTKYVFKPMEGMGGDPALTAVRAKKEADEIISQAKKFNKESARIRAEAAAKGREDGFAQGLAKGREEGRAAFDAELAPTLEALKDIENLYQNLWSASEAALVKLAIHVAERVIYHELATSPELIKKAFKAALDHLQEQHQAVFRVNPEDLDYLESVRSELRDQVKGLVKISFEADPSLDRGDLVMDTEAGRLDATLKQRLASVTAPVDEILNDNFDLDW